MPLLLPVKELIAGMTLAEPLVFKGRVMVAAGRPLAEDELDGLRRRFPRSLVRVADAYLDDIVTFQDDRRDREVALQAQGQIASCMTEVGRTMVRRSALSTRDFKTMESAALEMMRYLADHPVTAAMVMRTMDSENHIADHTGSVFYLSLVLGSAVKGYVVQERIRQTSLKQMRPSVAMDLVPLGLASMFADVAMFSLADVYDDPPERLSDRQQQFIREHPNRAADLLPELFPAIARAVIRSHHENHAGRGYPKGTEGDRQHVFSRIIRICDAFAAVTAVDVFKEAISPCRALWEMTRGPARDCFDPVLMPLFARLIQPFPIGARVELVDGRGAVVVRYNRNEPFRPVVVVAFDEHGARLPAERMAGPLDLSAEDQVRLARFGEEDLGYLYAPEDEPSNEPSPGQSAAVSIQHRQVAVTDSKVMLDQERRFERLIWCSFP
ncbi:MAG: hypothetical protein JJU36_10240 [Phycisphaeraceae bacterium]|nr:hypothetical protein [Phycisphaeraceae bacterium]